MRVLVLASLFGLFVSVVPAFAQDAVGTFEEGHDLWKRGHTEQALEKFRAVLGADPSNEEAYRMLQKAEYRFFLEVIAKGGEGELMATRIIELASQVERDRRRDPEAMDALVRDAVKGADFGVRRKATLGLMANHGEYAVPGLARYLGSNDVEERTNAILALTQLGTEAVLPLVECLESPNPELVRNAAAVLGRLKDKRSLAALLALAEDDSADEVAREIAERAVDAVGWFEGYEPANALDAYLNLAQRYYRADPEVILNFDASWTIWSWTDDGLTSRDVPRSLYHYELAEEAAFDALALDSDSMDAKIQIAMVALASAVEVDSYDDATSGVAELRARLEAADGLAMSQGTDVINATALGAMGEWEDNGVARRALGLLATMWEGPITPESALAQGLVHEAKGVRYAAAMACVKVNPAEPFENSDQVVGLLANAVAEGALRQVLVIEPNAETRTAMLYHLGEAGMFAVGAENGARGLMKAKNFSVYDAILIRSALTDITAFQVVMELKKDFRTRDIPVVVMSDDLARDRDHYEGNENVKGYLGDTENPEVYVGQVQEVAEQSLNDARRAALDVSRDAAATLSHADARSEVFDWDMAIDALADCAASDKPDDIRKAAMGALAHFGDATASDRLVAVFTDTANAPDVRAAAGDAIGACLDDQAPPAGTFDALMGGLADGAMTVRSAAGRALGRMDLTSDQRADVARANRIE